MLNKLKQMLDNIGIESEIDKYYLHLKDYKGFIYYSQGHEDNNSNDWFRSYGYDEDKLEIQISSLNLNTEFELINDCVNHNDWLAVLTPEEVFKRIKYCVDNKTDTYVEIEEFNIGDEVYAVDVNDFATYYTCDSKHPLYDKETYGLPFHIVQDKDNPKKYTYVQYYENYGYFTEEDEYSFISHSKQKCLEYIYLKTQKEIEKLIDKQSKLLKEMKI